MFDTTENVSRRDALKTFAAAVGGAALVAAGGTSLNAFAPAEAYAATMPNTTINNTIKKIAAMPNGTNLPAATMTSEELALAKAIFKEYNAYRKKNGQMEMTWDKNYVNVAYWSSAGCAAKGQLIHRLGIPDKIEDHVSDILQYSTWKKTAAEAVKSWAGSPNHKKMMLCNHTKGNAGVGVYKHSDGRWYYTIAYNFQGSNYLS